ncbi:uncharacterized protein LOC127788815 [Diospyros lotus]|uniref:uncharacterized protein LOC127788815 n=1 Tax=Diospyros lotus TaxID=55363 RepID=UPI00225002C1|nr:uncharacterized protein LOC127788815 [Diospyros lotus]
MEISTSTPTIIRAPIISIFISLLILSAQAHLSGVKSLPADAREYLAAHNDARLSKGLSPLHWDEKLAKFALQWATQRRDDCNHRLHSGGPYGENILWVKYDEYTPSMVTERWTVEEKNYDHKRLRCGCQPETSKCMCGHYTQVVWSNTKRLGCANATCNNELGLLVVCSYDPPGNYADENPFQPQPQLPPSVIRKPPPAPITKKSPPTQTIITKQTPPAPAVTEHPSPLTQTDTNKQPPPSPPPTQTITNKQPPPATVKGKPPPALVVTERPSPLQTIVKKKPPTTSIAGKPPPVPVVTKLPSPPLTQTVAKKQPPPSPVVTEQPSLLLTQTVSESLPASNKKQKSIRTELVP